MQDLTNFIAAHMGLAYSFVAIVFLLCIVEILRAKRKTVSIDIPQAVHLINRENAVVVDIRGNESFKNGHILDALSMASKDLLQSPQKLEKYKKKPLILVCQAGNESQKIAAFLSKHGYNVYSLSGGLRAWSDASMPVVKQ